MLHRGAAGVREIDFLDDLCPGVGSRRGRRQCKQRGNGETQRNSTVLRAIPSPKQLLTQLDRKKPELAHV